MSFHMPDSWYDPPEPLWEDEAPLDCETCGGERDHYIISWVRGVIEAECSECGTSTDREIEQDGD